MLLINKNYSQLNHAIARYCLTHANVTIYIKIVLNYNYMRRVGIKLKIYIITKHLQIYENSIRK